MNDKNPYQLDKLLIRRSFDNAADSYEDVAVLQREVGKRMLQRLELVKLSPQTVVDIGAGPGTQTRAIEQHYQDAGIIAFDLSINMLKTGRTHLSEQVGFVCGDVQSLPLATESVDLVFSNLTLQWCNELDRALLEMYRVLRPGGMLMFSTMGPDTLHELRNSWGSADQFNHVNAFMDMHDIGDALLRMQYNDPVMDVENIVLTYKDVLQLMHDLKSLGAHNVTAGRPAGLTGKGRLQKMQQAYEHYRQKGQLPATYEIIYGHAWKLNEQQQSSPMRPRQRPGFASIPADDLQRALKNKKGTE